VARVVFSLTDAQRDFVLAVNAGGDGLGGFDSRVSRSLLSRGIVCERPEREGYALTPLGGVVCALCERLATPEGVKRD
jgi:hypothetical protein